MDRNKYQISRNADIELAMDEIDLERGTESDTSGLVQERANLEAWISTEADTSSDD